MLNVQALPRWHSTHEVAGLVIRATGILTDLEEGKTCVVETLLEGAAAKAVTTVADAVVRAGISENKSRGQGGEKEGGAERRGEREHGWRKDRWASVA